MIRSVCHLFDAKLDTQVARMFGWSPVMGGKGWSPRKITALRGLYDQYRQEEAERGNEIPELDYSNPLEVYKKLSSFRSVIRMQHYARLKSSVKHPERAWDALKHSYSLDERSEAVSHISTLFSEEVDRLMGGLSGVSREVLINGFTTTTGEHIGGQFAILEGVYNTALEERQRYFAEMQESNYEKAFEQYQKDKKFSWAGEPIIAKEYQDLCRRRYEAYTKLLENWNELAPFALKSLTSTEGVKIGLSKEYATAASSDSFGENDIAAKWDISESKRDGWQEKSDLTSAYGSVGKQVRRLLSTVPQMVSIPYYKDGIDNSGNPTPVYAGVKTQYVVDSFGYMKFMDPVKTHQALQEMIGKAADSEDMLAMLCSDKAHQTAKFAWAQGIVNVLNANPQARTQFFVDFRKNFQPYSEMKEDASYFKKKGLKKFLTIILNKSKNTLLKKYEVSMTSHGKHPGCLKIWPFECIFDEGKNGKPGEVNWERLADLRNKVLEWTDEGTSAPGAFAGLKTYAHSSMLVDFSKNKQKSWREKREFLLEVFVSLGFDVEVDTVDAILNSNDLYRVQDELVDLFNPDGKYTGILYMLSGQEHTMFKHLCNPKDAEDKAKALEYLNNHRVSYRTIYNRDKGKGTAVKDHTEKLLNIISKYQEGFRVESRARYMDNTMYSHVAPSYLGDRLETIQRYVDTDNKQGLLQFLTEEYLQDPFFVSDDYIESGGERGKIYNTWLAEMVLACNNSKVPLRNSVASIFSYERDLGTSDKKFEDFTSKEHAIDMLVHFWADEEQNKYFGAKNSRDPRKRLSALYPIFVLGDAGVSKYIRAPRVTSAVAYSKSGNVIDPTTDTEPVSRIGFDFDEAAENKVIDAFFDIYIQEKRRMEIDKAMSYTMYANGKPVDKMSDTFSILTFLNPGSKEYSSKYRINKEDEYKADKVKAVIREYLNDVTLNGITTDEGVKIPSFKQRLENLKVLETVDIKVTNDRGQVTGTRKEYKNVSSLANPQNIDRKLKEFYWNTKLATAQQLQLMTIDPSFYHGTKDLQKRYKEIHAPGALLDLKARDWDGNLYSEDGVERFAYFDDLSINAEEFNPEFMEVILRTYAIQDREDVDAEIKNGIIKPLTGNAEKMRQDKLKWLLGKDNYKLYSQYTANTLTDGQGYRTLRSYRKVMGMAGRWTSDMENAYKVIASIEEKHTDGSDLTADELRQISSFAVTLQPIKPYMFTHEKYLVKVVKKDAQGKVIRDANGNPVTIDAYRNIPVQHKYAESLIIPALLPKGNKLRDLALWMDKHDVDLVGSTKIAKVGCFGQANFKYKTDSLGQLLNEDNEVISLNGKPLTVRDKNWKDYAVKVAQDTNGFTDALSRCVVHQVPYRDYRIQSNVPEHINTSQLFGTQVRKLIMSGISMMALKSEYLPTDFINLDTGDGLNTKSPLTGKNILALFNSLICANIWDSYEKFASNVSDIEKLADLLKQSTIGSSREAMDNLFSYVVTGSEEDLKKFFMPLFEGSLEHDTAALILSVFKKVVNKQQINGGSAVQVSAFGINGYEEDGNLRYVQDPDNNANILYAECEMPFDLSFTIDVKAKDGSTVKQKCSLSFEKYCFADAAHYGELIPSGEPIAKDSPEYKKYMSYTYKEVDGQLVPCKHTDPQAQVYKPLIEQDYPDLLSIIAYRIPTERDYSMINLKIKRFTSKIAGGTLKVPPQGTTIAGFDFDIDKLYFMRREYHKHYKNSSFIEENFSDSQKNEIWKSFYDENPEIKGVLEQARHIAETSHPAGLIKFNHGQVVHLTTLNSYWEQADIEKKFGKNKNDAFRESAQSLGATPTVNQKEAPSGWIEQYDFSKPPEENTRAARNNLLISLIQARLSDPETVRQRYTPGGFQNASDAARFHRELMFGDVSNVVRDGKVDLNAIQENIQNGAPDPEPNYDATDPYTILIYNQQNQVAGKLIGIFANQNTHHAFCSAMDVFELNEAISFCGHSFKDFLHKENPDEAYRVDLNMAEFLAASVDAVKDPVLNFLNLNTLTADAGAMLVRLGYSTKEVGLLFNQPIIHKICREAFNANSSSTTALTSAISNAKEELNSHLGAGNRGSAPVLSAENLALSIINNRLAQEQGGGAEDFMANDAVMQKAVLDLFEQVVKAAADVSAFVLNTKFTASNSVKSTLGGLYAQQEKVATYLDDFQEDTEGASTKYCRMIVAKGLKKAGLLGRPIDNDRSLMDYTRQQYLHQVRYNPFAYEQCMFDCNRKALSLLQKYYPYDRPLYSNARHSLQESASYGSLTEDEINSIHSEILVFALASQTKSLFNGEAAYERDGVKYNITNREYYREHFAEEASLMLSKYPELQRLALFKYITPQLIVKEVPDGLGGKKPIDTFKLSIQDVGGLDSEVKEDIRESWASLMEVDDHGYPKNYEKFTVGRDLFMYCYYQMGFQFSPISFMHLAPTQVKDNIKVPRNHSLEPKAFDVVHPQGDDVLVFSRDDEEMRLMADNFGAAYNNPNMFSVLHNESFCWPETLSVNDVRSLCEEALSHPELKFKIAKTLSSRELELFSQNVTGLSVPSNIFFNQETLENMSLEQKKAMHYGESRSYRQFLYEILNGENMGVQNSQFVKQYLLNHLDNTKWTLNVDWMPEVKNFVRKQLIGNNSIVDLKTGNYREYITIDVSTLNGKNDTGTRNRIVRIDEKDHKVRNAVWTPVLKIGDHYYMADNPESYTDSSENSFYMNKSYTMRYRRILPLGSTKAISYEGDMGPQQMSASMRYTVSLDTAPSLGAESFDDYMSKEYDLGNAETVSDSEPPSQYKEGDESAVSRQEMENSILQEFAAAYLRAKKPFNYKDFISQMTKATDEKIKLMQEAIKNAVRKDGIMVLDEHGNPMQAC